jgi:hypothetical protein
MNRTGSEKPSLPAPALFRLLWAFFSGRLLFEVRIHVRVIAPGKWMEEYVASKERCEWAARGLQDNDVVQAKLTLDDLRGFVERWHQYLGDELLEKALEDVCENALELESQLETRYRSALRQLIQRRLLLLAEQRAFRNAVAYLKMIRITPGYMRRELKKMLGQYEAGEFDPERFYRASEQRLDEREDEFKHALAGFQLDWPERLTDELRHRLNDWNLELLGRWKSDL